MFNKIIEYFMGKRIDKSTGQAESRLFKKKSTKAQEELKNKILDLIEKSNVPPPHYSYFPTPYLILLAATRGKKTKDKKTLEFISIIKNKFNIEINNFDNLYKVMLSFVILSNKVSVRIAHPKWINLGLGTDLISSSIRCLSYFSSIGRLSLLMFAALVSEESDETIINNDEINQELYRKWQIGLACVLADLLASSGLINVKATEYLDIIKSEREIKWRSWMLKYRSSLSLRPTIIVPSVLRISETIGKDMDYAYTVSSELVTVLSIIWKNVKEAISRGAIVHEVIADIMEEIRSCKEIKYASYYISNLLQTYRIQEEIVEQALLGHTLNLWDLDIRLLIKHNRLEQKL